MKKTAKTITLIILSLVCSSLSAQTPNWVWAKNSGNSGNDRVNRTATDAFGNLYVAGYYNSPTITFGATTLTNLGGNDIFVVKYDPFGNVIWAKGAGGSGIEIFESVTVDASGNVYLTGYYSSSSLSFGTVTISNLGATDLFIVKYDASGNVIWAKGEGSVGYDYGKRISTDLTGNVYVTGFYDSPSVSFGTYTLTNTGGTDMFIVKYDHLGNILWAKNEGGTTWDYAHNTTTDSHRNVYVTGYYASSSITFGTYTLTNTGVYDMFIVKYDSTGNVLWAKSEGGTGDDEIWSTTSDAADNLYITGFYSSPSITFGSTLLNNAGNEDAFIVKYNASGNVLWAKRIGGAGYDESWGSASDAAGNIYVTGYYSYAIALGTTTLTNPDNTGNTADLFIVKYDAAGNILWAKGSGNSGDDFGSSASADNSGNIYVAGSYDHPTINFGATTLTNGGNYDVFVAKLKDNCFAYYTSTYDSVLNNFNITVNPATSSLANSYHWDFGDGSTSTIANPSHTYTVDTVYNVCLKIYTISGDSCEYCRIIGKDYLGNIYKSLTNGFTINVSNNITTGIKPNQEQSPQITIFPNPSNSIITVSSTVEIKTIEIHNILGELIYKINTGDRQTTIDLREQPDGIYTVKTTDTKKNITTKALVIQHNN